MSTVLGRRAEQSAAEHLQRLGYQILQQNWRTRWCEIDLVAHQSGTIYFVEVKYRSNSYQGTGLLYITPVKLAQMSFAADFWMAKYARPRWQYSLAAVEVSGKTFEVTEIVKDII